ncbi:hypothetical protein PLICRDRAFT_177042 [Plicaturopsis crispa FD-325 SS-3]|nr:hypothetical protein PLICRDRAFT_177042 [Plicaturopsis crispa FD-325 SS-3]
MSVAVQQVPSGKLNFTPDYEYRPEWFSREDASYTAPPPEEDPLPAGFPEKAEGPAVWDGKELQNQPERWLYTFTDADNAEIDAAVKAFVASGRPFKDVSQETFPLPSLKAELEKTIVQVERGLGFRILRGFPIEKYSREEQIIIFLGVSSHVGEKRLNQQQNRGIHHLKDISGIPADKRPRIIVKGQTGQDQVFHTDAGDIIGMVALGEAETGGLSRLASVGATYNTLAERRRDVLRTITSPIWKNNAGLIHYLDRPDGKGKVLVAQYARRAYFPFGEDKQQPAGSKPVTYEQNLALDAITAYAEKHSFDIKLKPGDFEYANNLTLFHARTASVDSEAHTRHLLRIWIRNEAHVTPHPSSHDAAWENLTRPVEQAFPIDILDDHYTLTSGQAWVDPRSGAVVQHESVY